MRPLARPADRLLFAPTQDRYGVRLALVFGNHAPGGQCPYFAAGKCRHCDIGAGEGAAFTSELNRQRLAWFQGQYRQILPEVVHLVLYNSGSFLNPQELPVDLLDEILVWRDRCRPCGWSLWRHGKLRSQKPRCAAWRMR